VIAPLSSLRARGARLALYAAAALLVWAVVVYVADGLRFRIVGIGITARNPERPAILAAALVLISLFADRRVIAGTARDGLGRLRAGAVAFADAISRPAWSVTWCLAIGMLVYGLTLGSRAASGADSSGYVSQAALWADRELIQTKALASAVPWPQAVATFAPLGYRPATEGLRIVPTYPPGLPLIMALFRAIGGPCAVFFVVPLCAGALVLLTYALGLRLGSPLAALAATVLTAASPTTLFMTLAPMSDLPVTVFWIAALVLALGVDRQRPIASGLMVGIAILIRPNLAPLVVVPFALLAFGTAPHGRARLLRTLALFAAPVALFVGVTAAINAYLYGGPLRSGYGDASTLYSRANIVPNVKNYGEWLFDSQGILIAVALLALASQLLWRTSLARRLLAMFVGIVITSYLPYIVFEVWWYLRFLLPALPILFFFGADLVASLTARLGRTPQAIVTALFVAAISIHGIAFAFERDSFGAGEGEHRYVEVGRFVREHLSRKAVILAMQHSGSISYYAGATTVRYDLLTTAWLDRAVELLRGLGYGPYLVLENWEEPVFRARFKDHQTVKTLDSRLFAVLDSNTNVRIYDLSGQPLPPTPRHIRHIPRTECPGRWDE
jgi:hypothetical protein